MMWIYERSIKMGNYISIVRELTLLVTLVSIFTVLVVTMLKLIRRAAFFQGKTAVTVAVSLALLFLVALSQFLVFPATGSGNAVNAAVDYFYPMPWVALAVAASVVLSQVMLLASRIPPSEKPEPPVKKTEHAAVKSRSPGRPKKAESGRPPAPQESGVKGKNEAKKSTTTEGAATTSGFF
jgi:uncharacterized membrane protein YozB (DUF420 family)